MFLVELCSKCVCVCVCVCVSWVCVSCVWAWCGSIGLFFCLVLFSCFGCYSRWYFVLDPAMLCFFPFFFFFVFFFFVFCALFVCFSVYILFYFVTCLVSKHVCLVVCVFFYFYDSRVSYFRSTQKTEKTEKADLCSNSWTYTPNYKCSVCCSMSVRLNT